MRKSNMLQKNRGRLLLLIMSMLTLLLVTACKPQEEVYEVPRIGISFDTFVVERWQRDLEMLVAQLNEAGAEVFVQIANEDRQKQQAQIRELIQQKVDVLIVVPNDAYSLTEVLEEARREGISILAYDRLVFNAPVDAYVSFDNQYIGFGMTDRLLEGMGREQSTVLLINGDPKDYNSTMIQEGVYRALNLPGRAGKTIVADEVWALEWREQYAREVVESYLKTSGELDGIIAANDVLAMGAIEVLARWQLAGQVMVVSQDAEISACQRIVEGTQLATVYKPINVLAATAAEIALKLYAGENIEAEDTIDNGISQVPYHKLPVTVIDRENIDDVIIDSGFHRKEDVYMNVQP
ncbi:MAG: substrate-binding domain-containing protein [Bacillota bacterium]|nr:substrate-binding domain-containing protein [Bacillota bacterium]MDW7678095.1 substrate-binding domain-containing protein [Bacillota bacterium]